VSASVEEFLLEDVKNYRYLTHGNVSVAGQDDAELYRQLVEAMDIMGFTKDEQDGMLFRFRRHHHHHFWLRVLSNRRLLTFLFGS